MRALKISLAAKSDVREIARAIAVQNMDAALRFYEAVDQTCLFLSRHPDVRSQRRPVDRSLDGMRSYGVIGFRTYLVSFLPGSRALRILRVMHGARDLDHTMGPAD